MTRRTLRKETDLGRARARVSASASARVEGAEARRTFEGGRGREEVLRDEGEYEGEGDDEGIDRLDRVREELLPKAEYPHRDLEHENGEEDEIEVVEPVFVGVHTALVHERRVILDIVQGCIDAVPRIHVLVVVERQVDEDDHRVHAHKHDHDGFEPQRIEDVTDALADGRRRRILGLVPNRPVRVVSPIRGPRGARLARHQGAKAAGPAPHRLWGREAKLAGSSSWVGPRESCSRLVRPQNDFLLWRRGGRSRKRKACRWEAVNLIT